MTDKKTTKAKPTFSREFPLTGTMAGHAVLLQAYVPGIALKLEPTKSGALELVATLGDKKTKLGNIGAERAGTVGVYNPVGKEPAVKALQVHPGGTREVTFMAPAILTPKFALIVEGHETIEQISVVNLR